MTSLNETIHALLLNKESIRKQSIGVIRVTGNDSKKFLQGQITCDINKLTENNSLYGAVCSIKGRIITNFFLVQKGEEVLMLMSDDLIEKSIQHFKKYAVFFKVELVDISEEFNIFNKVSLPTIESIPSTLSEELGTTNDSTGINITLSQYPVKLECRIARCDISLEEKNTELDALSILAARPLIGLEHSENVLPQWLNMQRTGGISFTKGCYTGQEIVARMQYKGKSPKQLALFMHEGKINSPSSIIDKAGKTIGSVLHSSHLAGITYSQVILNNAPQDANGVFLDKHELENLNLPYLLEG